MFTIYENNEQVFEALQAGASGYLLKTTPPEEMLEALRELHAGGSPMSAQIARKVVRSFRQETASHENAFRLTAKESEVLDGLARGLLYKEIADHLGINTSTVRQRIHKIYAKLHVQNRTEALNKVQGNRPPR
jgi:DNA-binding NarL/FixJ family response regulator